MSKFNVTLPFAGYITLMVEAEDKESAIEAAFGADCQFIPNETQPTGISDVEVEEWEFLAHITRGNVSYAPRNSASAEPADDDEGDAP